VVEKSMNRPLSTLLLLLILAIVCLLSAPMIGQINLDLDVILRPFDTDLAARVFWQIRLPRVILGFVAGATLGIAGMCFQALFNNPLATPYTLGISSGAALGASGWLLAGFSFSLPGLPGTSIAAFIGAMFAMSLVWLIARRLRSASSVSLLLAGVAVSFCFSSLILFIQYLADFSDSYRILRWMMGGLESVRLPTTGVLIILVSLASVLIYGMSAELNLLSINEELAISRGVNAKAIKLRLFILTSFTVAAVVSFCGPIGFVGMMAPHICRLLVGSDHRYLAPATVLFGGSFLVVCDTIARFVLAPAEIPVGVITALCGGPFFLWLLLRKGKI
jgi:iron complex transport system permease protein